MGALLRYNYGTHRAGATRLFSGLPPFVNVLYEDSGAFKVATVLADSDSTLQVEAPHGKRAKIKSKDVLLRFPEPWSCLRKPKRWRAASKRIFCGSAAARRNSDSPISRASIAAARLRLWRQ